MATSCEARNGWVVQKQSDIRKVRRMGARLWRKDDVAILRRLLRHVVNYASGTVTNNDPHKDMSHNAGRILQPVGLTAHEENVYLLLLSQPELTPTELAELLDQPERLVAACLNILEDKGLVARSVEGCSYRTIAPDVMMQSLIAHKREELRRAEHSVGRLLTRAREPVARRNGRENIVEIITGHDALVSRLDHLQRSAEREVLCFISATCPYRLLQRMLESVRGRGMRTRLAYDGQVLEAPGVLEDGRRQVAAGREVRIVSSLPVALAIFDRRLALLPGFDADHEGVPEALIVGPSALLDALLMYFETVWDRASPLGSTACQGIDDIDDGEYTAEYDALLSLLAAGFKDEAIARRLGLSTRTLDRRIHTMMKSLEAKTRFQAGWLAAHAANDWQQ